MKVFNTLLIIALLLGLMVGYFWPSIADQSAWIGELYLALLRMILLPLVVVSILWAFCRSGGANPVWLLGRGGIFYLLSSLLAAMTGVVCFWLLAPAALLPTPTSEGVLSGSINWIELLIPSNLFGALAQGQMLPVIVFSLLFGAALFATAEKGALQAPLGALFSAIMRLTGWIVWLTPLGGFSLLASGVAHLPADLPTTLGTVIATVLIAALWHSIINLPLLGRVLGGGHIWRYFWQVKEAPLVALATASSAATLPVSMRVSQQAGIAQESGALLLPLGATLNMDGSALYHAVVVLFLAALSGIDLGLSGSLMVVALVMLSSAGTSAIPGGGIAMLAMLSAILGIDPLWLGFYLLIDRFLDNIITSVNVWGDLVALKVVDRPVNESV